MAALVMEAPFIPLTGRGRVSFLLGPIGRQPTRAPSPPSNELSFLCRGTIPKPLPEVRSQSSQHPRHLRVTPASPGGLGRVEGSSKADWWSVRMAISKRLQTINAREGVEKREPSHTVGRNVSWCSHYGKQYEVFLKNQK